MLKVDLFPFADVVELPGRVKLDKSGEVYKLSYIEGDFKKSVAINTNCIANGNVAMVIYSPLNQKLLVHYGFSALCEAMDVTHSEFLKLTQLHGLMQLDRYGDTIYIKVFLPKGQYCLDSDTNSYANKLYLNADCIHPLDWQYMPTFDLLDAKIDNGKLILELNTCRPSVDAAAGNMHINYAGQCLELRQGQSKYEFVYVPGENAYVGYPYSRRKGRVLEIDRAVLSCSR